MAKLENLMASLEKSEAKIEKIKVTIEKHFKQAEKKAKVLAAAGFNVDYSNIKFGGYMRSAEFVEQVKHIENQKWNPDTNRGVEQYYELCDLINKLDDIRGSYNKLVEAEKTNDNWKVKVVAEKTRVDFASSAPKVIVDFVNRWGELAYEWMMENVAHADETSIKKTIENEKQVKIIQLTMRVTNVVGTITDAAHLEIGEKGDLVGIIEGEKGKATVETITAGGWNIQCFHYRTIVNKI